MSSRTPPAPLPVDPGILSRPEIWADLCPDLHVEDSRFWSKCATPDFPTQKVADFDARIRREGYVHCDPPSWHLPISGMAGAIRLLHANRLPPVFAFHFDEFWLVLAQLRRVIATILGDGYVMLPDFWAWHVDPMTADSGWPPHRDKGRRALFPDGRPQSLTLWLPLTDATPINGCIYVVPADRDPTYNTAAEESLQFTLSDIRALPAAAGSILAWTQAIIHWGGHAASRDAPPRISLSCEFQRGDVAPFNSPLLPPAAMPDFATRHSLIGRQVLRYRQMEPLDGALESCAAAMASFGRNRCEPVGA